MDIERLWHELEQEPGSPMRGWVQRRVLPESGLDVFLTLDRPGFRRTLRFSVPAQLIPDSKRMENSKGIEVAVVGDDDDRRKSLLLSLQDRRYTAVFSSLCSDIIGVLQRHGDDELLALRAFIDRLDKWQQFLERVGTGALSAEAQLGLYAEITVLLQDLLLGPPSAAGVAWWTGPEGTHQDFQLRDAALEIKATSQVSPERIIISSERQLDSTGVSRLLLVHSSWDVRRGTMSTLPARVEEVRARLRYTDSLNEFENRLLSVGYSDAQHDHYSDTTYTLRRETIFDVRPGFPRLTESSLPAGISSVRYSIDLAMCRPFEVGRTVLAKLIAEASHGTV